MGTLTHPKKKRMGWEENNSAFPILKGSALLSDPGLKETANYVVDNPALVDHLVPTNVVC